MVDLFRGRIEVVLSGTGLLERGGRKFVAFRAHPYVSVSEIMDAFFVSLGQWLRGWECWAVYLLMEGDNS